MVLEWWERYRRIILLTAAVLFVGCSYWIYQRDQSHKTDELPLHSPAYAASNLETKELTDDSAAAQPAKSVKATPEKDKDKEPLLSPLYVDVKGQVKNPGLYQFEPGTRVANAIEKAGGALPDADLVQINLAAPLTDGAALVIPAKGATAPVSASIGLVQSASSVSTTGASSAINLNMATVEELMSLPGIGEARAKAIMEYRTKQGPFRSADDLKQIEGIGEKMFARIKDRLVVK
ncbi:helix-hairpin-helix domain-containing protein [Brevibacillus porteri]|uniref:Competence protein ComEA n=1 Tax=Brevibacillus porteri TaxID=2126350 RepID=A0ABX5FMZ9_9BACL|nr:helix-hairpin-helix domain-containing protein [Brevibacillus porteri]MED1802178.1 helix-hairpin-helix domain-containing protein [Brevibacillus porteri]MED2129652.1 helix-hairpin-helix domain-containing protein [Brevibacillus porteri]MED2743439.1 helix-hairpin-helix domain-containing protein [Brevibacillus porteri]MED2817716.1 helix-hairpin-helix domain-containing protein [Brevibacillus porteri]MED2897898.1 helix-hairpin-helix domain-containing protein [Brevibacillus porteri]